MSPLTLTGSLRAALGLAVQAGGPHAIYETRAPGEPLTLHATDATGKSLQWYFEGQAIAGATGSMLNITAVTAANVGNYVVRSTDAVMREESNWLTLNVATRTGDTAVDTSFASSLIVSNGANTFELGRVFPDGRVIVHASSFPGHTRVYFDVGLRPDGGTDPAFNQRQGSARAIFPDGSYIAADGLRRRADDGSAIGPFQVPPEFSSAAFQIYPAGIEDRLLLVQGTTMVRVSADGTRDRTFAYDPATLTAIGFVAADSQGRVVVGESVDAGSGRTVRITSSGTLDSGFAPIANGDPIVGRWLLGDDSLIVARSQLRAEDGGRRRVFTHYGPSGVADPAWDVSPWLAGTGAVTIDRDGRIYFSEGFGIQRLLTQPRIELDPTFYVAAPSVTILQLQSEERLVVGGNFAAIEGHTSPSIARIDTTHVRASAAPTVQVDVTPAANWQRGTRVTLSGRAAGGAPFTWEWRALDGGALPADIRSPDLVFPALERAQLGRYQVRVTGSGGATLSRIVDLRPSVFLRFTNVSSRARLPAEDTLILGFAIDGQLISRNELLRGAGPALLPLGVGDPLPDPVLSLHDGRGEALMRNDNWVDDAQQRRALNLTGAFAFPPASRDASIPYDTYYPGAYTLVLRDATGRAGTGLIEAYAVNDPLSQHGFSNVSVRGRSGAGDAPLIAGFTVADSTNLGRSARVLVRAIGPGLREFNVPDTAADPTLTVFDADGRPLASNNDWNRELAPLFAAGGAFPLTAGSRDAALVIDLPPGTYTVHATSPEGSGGAALLELFLVK